jgi:hypothetical protein
MPINIGHVASKGQFVVGLGVACHVNNVTDMLLLLLFLSAFLHHRHQQQQQQQS